MEQNNARHYVYICQIGAFAFMTSLGIIFFGDRLFIELQQLRVDNSISIPEFHRDGGDGGKNVYRLELAFFLICFGVALVYIEETKSIETSVLATSFGSWCIFSGSLHHARGMPAILCAAFLWNGLQLIVLAWVGGSYVDGKWTGVYVYGGESI